MTAIGYDAEWRKTSETEGCGTAEVTTTAYTCDAEGNLATLSDARNNSYGFTYDLL